MDPWEVLGISPTIDEAAVRRAYAVLLKANRPDDDMQAFANLRKAYELAQAYCKSSGVDAHDSLDRYDREQAEIERLPDVPLSSPEEMKPIPDFKLSITADEFMDQFKALMKDYASYPDSAKWLSLMNQVYDMNYWERNALCNMLVHYLCFYPFFPSYIWDVFEAAFDWNKYFENHRYSEIVPMDLNLLQCMKMISCLLLIEELINCPGVPEYIVALTEYYFDNGAIKKEDMNKKLHGLHIEFDTLPTAMKQRFSLLISIGAWEILCVPDQFLISKEDHHFAALLRGEAMRNKKNYTGALNVYEDILRQNPNHAEALRWSAFLMEQLGDTYAAVKRYEKLLDVFPKDPIAQREAKRLRTALGVNQPFWHRLFFSKSDANVKSMLYAYVFMVLAVVVFLFPFVFALLE